MGENTSAQRWQSAGQFVGAAALSLTLLTGCSGVDSIATKFAPSEYGVAASPKVSNANSPRKGGGRYQVGKPYKVAGRWYTPHEQPNLDVTGKASWYGPNFHGRQTANGEVFDQNYLSAAHPTLPLPSYVRVTNQSNGRSAIVRVNDRGPYAHGRVIDLSKRTAQVLGFINQGTANVRVQYVGRAPLEGNDAAYLMASVQSAPGLEQGGGTRMAYQQGTQVADTGSPSDAIGALIGQSQGESVSDQVAAYAGSGGRLDIDGAFAAASEASSVEALDSWKSALDETARDVDVDLGTFVNAGLADAIVERFAYIGAVDRTATSYEGRPATQLTLSYLKPGVTHADVNAVASDLGLNTRVLY